MRELWTPIKFSDPNFTPEVMAQRIIDLGKHPDLDECAINQFQAYYAIAILKRLGMKGEIK